EALSSQSLEASPGRTGESSGKRSQAFEYVLKYPGRFDNEKDYGNIIVKANSNGEFVRLRDVADVEFGSSMYDIYSTLNGKPSAAITIKQSYGSNVSEVIKNVKTLLEELNKTSFPK
ncbi:efflux RND transporter permease subunit, partial [Escherichia coli]|nr:efflux RND transporter permease subunit [Escherichia coli]